MRLPDPILTANIYYAGHLDDLITHVIGPFWRALGAMDFESSLRLWLLRYGRRGEHLKIRVHGLESHRLMLQQLLRQAADAYFLSLDEPVRERTIAEHRDAPPIDLEDRLSTRAVDRSLLWTTYQRSPVSFGDKPLLGNDDYVACLTDALACGCDLVLDVFLPERHEKTIQKLRTNEFLKMLIAGLSGLEIDVEQRCRYLSYHRDWILRSAIVRNGLDLESGDAILADFDDRISRMQSGVDVIEQVIVREWDSPGEGSVSYPAWRRALAEFGRCLAPFRAMPDFNPDPFTEDPIFLPLFKVFHGIANQLGLARLEEAFACHLTLWAAGNRDAAGRRLQFVPA